MNGVFIVDAGEKAKNSETPTTGEPKTADETVVGPGTGTSALRNPPGRRSSSQHPGVAPVPPVPQIPPSYSTPKTVPHSKTTLEMVNDLVRDTVKQRNAAAEAAAAPYVAQIIFDSHFFPRFIGNHRIPTLLGRVQLPLVYHKLREMTRPSLIFLKIRP